MVSIGRIVWGAVVLLGCGGGVFSGSGSGSGPATTNVAIDDEIGSICMTKADGRYRCWDRQGAPIVAIGLPHVAYTRVQLAHDGLIGLTRAGYVHADGIPVPTTLPSIAEFRATNLWGHQGLCVRTTAGAFGFGNFPTAADAVAPRWTFDSGPYSYISCAYEGLTCAVRSDGTVAGHCESRMPGSDWKQIAESASITCGLTTDGEVRCGRASTDNSSAAAPPVFAPGPYVQVAAMWSVACALRADGDVSCVRSDGAPVSIARGPYVHIEAGQDLLCGIRPDGTTSCFRQDVPGTVLWGPDPHVTALLPLSPALDASW
jgi:hypothetical protein